MEVPVLTRWLSDPASGRSLALGGSRDHVDAAVLAGVEMDDAVGDGEQRVIAALTDVAAGVELVADLADDDVAGDDRLAAELLDAAALTVRITTVTRRTLTFFMCHDKDLKLRMK